MSCAGVTLSIDNLSQAYVIKIGERFFVKFDKAGRTQTAWTLGGASFFAYGCSKGHSGITARLESKGIAYKVCTVGVL
jgi:hypothetical protein